MTNTDYFDMIEKRIVRLMELRKQGISITTWIPVNPH